MKRVLVVGGGFGGVKAALELAGLGEFSVTLVSKHNTFRYYPGLYRTATGGRRVQTSIPLQRIFDRKNVRLLKTEVVKLDRLNKTVITSDDQKLHYDVLILALGVVTNYFGIDGLEEHSFSIKSADAAAAFKSHLHQQMIDDGKPDVNYLVVGGGPTGIEVAGALPAYLRQVAARHGIKRRAIRVSIVEAMPRLLPSLPPATARAVRRRLKHLGVKVLLGKKVEGQTADSLVVDGKHITSESVVWTAGVTNHPFYKQNNFNLDQRGKVIVDSHLAAEDNIYVIGDNAATAHSGLAQTAVYDGRFVARNLRLLAQGREQKPYLQRKITTVIPVGQGWAVVNRGAWHFSGRIGWWLRSIADWIGFHDLEPFWRATAQWAKEFGAQEDCPYCSNSKSQISDSLVST